MAGSVAAWIFIGLKQGRTAPATSLRSARLLLTTITQGSVPTQVRP
ncbi:hypothetical protein [Synechococcus sp. M16CYN]